MKKPVQVTLIALVVVLALATVGLFIQYRSQSAQLADARLSADERYGQTIAAIAEIQDSLDAVALGSETVQLTPGGAAAEEGQAGPNRRLALDRIAALRASIEQSKARISTLEETVKKSGGKIGGLEKLIANLRRDAESKEALVAVLSGRVDSLQTEVTGLTAAVQQKADTLRTREKQIEERRREAAIVYYLIGSKEELTDAGAIKASGGFLGMGKTLIATGSLDQGTFKALDTDRLTMIPIAAAKARVISAQPSSSYELKPVNGQLELHIIDPIEFRRVKQVVILTS